jgi:hypothetical protein
VLPSASDPSKTEGSAIAAGTGQPARLALQAEDTALHTRSTLLSTAPSDPLEALYVKAQMNARLAMVLQDAGFRKELDSLHDALRHRLHLQETQLAASLAVSSGLSVGYVAWLLRGGILVSSLLSSLPAWTLTDPLPILARPKREKDEDEDESLEGMLHKSKRRKAARTDRETDEANPA